MAKEQGHHQHEALKHRHKHYHVTHYLHQGENWGHLLSTHTHEHNHPALEHVHIPHRDMEKGASEGGSRPRPRTSRRVPGVKIGRREVQSSPKREVRRPTHVSWVPRQGTLGPCIP